MQKSLTVYNILRIGKHPYSYNFVFHNLIDMSIEIERKYLVYGEFKNDAHKSYFIKQGYLSRIPERTVRIRIKGHTGYITIKGKSNSSGVSRFEFEKEITLEEANSLLELCEEGIIEKIRYLVTYEGNLFEVDEFIGRNKGLVLAEIELKDESQEFKKPSWLGKEVQDKKNTTIHT